MRATLVQPRTTRLRKIKLGQEVRFLSGADEIEWNYSVTVLELMPFGLLLECLMVGVRTD